MAMDVMFYQLLHAPLERALPVLLEKTLERKWKAIVQCGSQERVASLDGLLWTYRDESFLPHGAAGSCEAEEQPVLLTLGDENPNGAEVRFFVDGIDAASVALSADGEYERLVLMFDGTDDEQLSAARSQWKRLKDAGLALQYWQQTENGGWEKMA